MQQTRCPPPQPTLPCALVAVVTCVLLVQRLMSIRQTHHSVCIGTDTEVAPQDHLTSALTDEEILKGDDDSDSDSLSEMDSEEDEAAQEEAEATQEEDEAAQVEAEAAQVEDEAMQVEAEAAQVEDDTRWGSAGRSYSFVHGGVALIGEH